MSLFLKHDHGFQSHVGEVQAPKHGVEGCVWPATLYLRIIALFCHSQSLLASLAPSCIRVLADASLAAEFPLWLCKGLSSPQPSGLSLNVFYEREALPDYCVLCLPLLFPITLPSWHLIMICHIISMSVYLYVFHIPWLESQDGEDVVCPH